MKSSTIDREGIRKYLLERSFRELGQSCFSAVRTLKVNSARCELETVVEETFIGSRSYDDGNFMVHVVLRREGAGGEEVLLHAFSFYASSVEEFSSGYAVTSAWTSRLTSVLGIDQG